MFTTATTDYSTHRATILHQVLTAKIARKRAAMLRVIARTPALVEKSRVALQSPEGHTKVKA